MHQSSFEKMKHFLLEFSEDFKHSKCSVLDFGSFDVNGSYRSLFANEKWNYIGLDVKRGPNVDFVPDDQYHWKSLADNQFDLVISGQALEHCEFFWLIFQEIHRVLKPSGLTCVIAPSSGPEHRYPVDCWRFYPDGMSALCKYSGLEVVKVQTDWNPPKFDDGSEEWKDTMLVARKKAP